MEIQEEGTARGVQVALEKMTVEDGLALRRIAEASDLSYQVATELHEPSRQRRMILEAWDLPVSEESSAVVSEVFQV